MTKIEAIKYAVHAHKHWDEDLSLIMERNGNYNAGSWDDREYAEKHGWKFVGHASDLARELGLI